VDVREGDRVRRGDPVLRFDTRTSPDAVARLEQAREAYADAERQVRRLGPLLEQGAVAESDFDAANTRFKTAEADLRDARLKVEVVSPIDGVVTLLAVNAGDAVGAGTVVAQVASLDTVRIEAEVSTDVARELNPGARVFLAEAGDEGGEPVNLKGAEVPPSTTREGTLRRVSLGADPVTRLHLVEAVVANPGARLRPGEYVTLNVLVREVGPTRIAPRAALLTDRSPEPGDAVPVYALEDDIARLRTVQVGTVSEDDVEIREGLEAGDRVVTFGANRLQDGAKIKIHAVDGVRAEPPS
jgi:membrane fusion protein (multidrug efflux system)